MSHSIGINSQKTYEIKIRGQLDESWLDWFRDIESKTECVGNQCLVTTLTNIITDQSGLVGLIRQLHGLGIVMISIQQVPRED